LMRKVVLDKKDGFALNLIYFIHHREKLPFLWGGGEPSFADTYSSELEKLFGPARRYEDPITPYHADIAASLQARYEEVFFHLLNMVYTKTKISNLCLAGGCALNSVANGKIFSNTPFREVYIQSAAHDSGGAIGAAFYAYHAIKGFKRKFIMTSSYWGPEYTLTELQAALETLPKDSNLFSIAKFDDQEILVKNTAEKIAAGKIVGWFQGRMEWGPRALGNRSILVDPRNPNMKEILNSRIKKREPFRPFAPSILLEATGEYFEQDYPDPFMMKVYPIRPEKQELLPAVTHLDGTGRLQTVSEEENPLYYKLIKEFAKITNIPVLLNTSFNENEPIVCTPEEALKCFVRTRMDVLVLGPYIIERFSHNPQS
jgi:carbamoyltransferase